MDGLNAPTDNTDALLSRLTETRAKVRRALLDSRNAHGRWTGALSSSALATATAVTALGLVARVRPDREATELRRQVASGLSWLARNANRDGGWGDTVKSHSNISTTTLAWAAFAMDPDPNRHFQEIMNHAKSWLHAEAGGTDPCILAKAIIRRYGRDRTFSIPILTHCALTGRLGPEPACWNWVKPLPFELAALPASWFATLKLPVVSYALPALIAIGQVRHARLPARNPFTRRLRSLILPRTLRLLNQIQPENGGFLEATPLTSFVTMSLVGGGHGQHPVVRSGTAFLAASARPDGSWPIDTNLATWLTTLAINALSAGGQNLLPTGHRQVLRDWLLSQQLKQVHPYTNAAPGGWAWTDLPGGVPDADDTAGALLALRSLDYGETVDRTAILAGIQWLLRLQNRDGGMPTFCRGWGTLPFDRSSPDLTAHALRAWIAWEPLLAERNRHELRAGIRAGLRYLRKSQDNGGAWQPLWFGNQHSADEKNRTYGTAKTLLLFAEMDASFWPPGTRQLIERGLQWLISAQHRGGGWGGGDNEGPVSVEETALAVETLAALAVSPELRRLRPKLEKPLRQGLDQLLTLWEGGAWKHPEPIGFYFAKLWYYEALYPIIFTAAALERATVALQHSNQ